MRNKNLDITLTGIIGLLVISLLATVACQTPATDTETPAGAPSETRTRISAQRLAEFTGELADDRMEGRSPGSSGARVARRYLAETMEAFGLRPAFAGQWEQPIELIGITSVAPEIWRFSHADGNVDLVYSDDFIAGSGVQREHSAIDDAEVVFVGYGIQAPEYGWDDFKGADLTGKVLLVLNNDPEWDPDLFAGERRLYYGRWDYKYASAARQGAIGAIIVHTTPSAGYPWQVVQTSWSGTQFELPAAEGPRLEVAAWVTEEAARRLTGLGGMELDDLVEAARSADFEPVPMGLSTSLALSNTLEAVEGANVGGLLTGSDPDLSRELVVYTAHYDHLGRGKPDEEGDDVYNGALDNASGCAAVLAIAEAFTRLAEAPVRSVLFLFVDAEEQGLLGSEYFARHPIVPPGRIVANLNIDGANIWGATHDIGIIGNGKSSLDQVVELIAAQQGRSVKPEQFPDRGSYYRSDQFNFAKIGVPAIYLDTGTDFVERPEGWGKEQIEAWEATHYHQPSDELTDDWDYAGFVQDAQLMLEAGIEVANAPEMPVWLPGDEFEAARQAALDDVK